MSLSTTTNYGSSCNCYHSHSDIYQRLSKIERILERVNFWEDKDDIIFEQKQEIERLNNNIDDISKALKPLFNKKEIG